MLSCILMFISSNPCIIISWGSCVLACILASSHPHTFGFMCAFRHPHILASSYSKVLVCLLASSRPHVLTSWGSCVLACILAFLDPHRLRFLCIWLYPRILKSSCHVPRFVCVCLYPHILTFSYSQVNVCFLVSLHSHIVSFMCLSFCPCILSS